MRFQFVIGDASVLDRHFPGQRAVAFLVVGLGNEIRAQEAVSLAVPVDTGPTHADTRQVGAQVADRQRNLVAVVAKVGVSGAVSRNMSWRQ
jgi:hypothetical protein